MTPAELQTHIDGKVKIRNMYRDSFLRHMDRMQATQTANLMYIQGRTTEKPVDPGTCMAFAWDRKNTQPITEEMTEEMMEEFDQNMSSHRRGAAHG